MDDRQFRGLARTTFSEQLYFTMQVVYSADSFLLSITFTYVYMIYEPCLPRAEHLIFTAI